MQVVYKINVNGKIEKEIINNDPKSWNNVEVNIGDGGDNRSTIDVDYEYTG